MLGPLPLRNGTDVNGGRVNDIAFAATDGDGVWRTRNCSTSATTWDRVTDAPEIESIAISGGRRSRPRV